MMGLLALWVSPYGEGCDNKNFLAWDNKMIELWIWRTLKRDEGEEVWAKWQQTEPEEKIQWEIFNVEKGQRTLGTYIPALHYIIISRRSIIVCYKQPLVNNGAWGINEERTGGQRKPQERQK